MYTLSSVGSLENSCRGFACPQEFLDKPLLGSIVIELARETLRRFLEQHRASLDKYGDCVSEQFESWLGTNEVDFATCWHETFGYASWLLRTEDEIDVVRNGAALALHLSACGQPGEWATNLGAPAYYRWARWLLPKSEHIAVRSDGARAVVVTSLGATSRKLGFTRVDAGWLSESSDLVLLPEIGKRPRQIVLLAKDALGDARIAPSLPPLIEQIPPEIVTLWRLGLNLISEHAPNYDDWVHDVVRYVALIEPAPGVVHSGSYPYRYGLIHASARSSPMSLAELLVHEASHQYFYLLSRLWPVDDGTDRNLYYSPLVARNRPLDRILFAYHACANILLLYRLCQESGVADNGYCAQHQGEVMKQLEQLSAPLNNNPALTWSGRSLYDPLVKRVA